MCIAWQKSPVFFLVAARSPGMLSLSLLLLCSGRICSALPPPPKKGDDDHVSSKLRMIMKFKAVSAGAWCAVCCVLSCVCVCVDGWVGNGTVGRSVMCVPCIVHADQPLNTLHTSSQPSITNYHQPPPSTTNHQPLPSAGWCWGREERHEEAGRVALERTSLGTCSFPLHRIHCRPCYITPFLTPFIIDALLELTAPPHNTTILHTLSTSASTKANPIANVHIPICSHHAGRGC
jgi:hypothetical protein